VQPPGRFPANLIHDGSDEATAPFPDSNGSGAARSLKRGKRGDDTGWGTQDQEGQLRDAGSGSAARFFYCAKANKKDRGDGNNHPTVKPTDLMRYLCRLVTPVGGTVLDPFMGSGSTGKAARLEGFKFIGIDREAEYVEIARKRIGV
jgi:site-specific DNA-methyltransferase (adenine-specific)